MYFQNLVPLVRAARRPPVTGIRRRRRPHLLFQPEAQRLVQRSSGLALARDLHTPLRFSSSNTRAQIAAPIGAEQEAARSSARRGGHGGVVSSRNAAVGPCSCAATAHLCGAPVLRRGGLRHGTTRGEAERSINFLCNARVLQC